MTHRFLLFILACFSLQLYSCKESRSPLSWTVSFSDEVKESIKEEGRLYLFLTLQDGEPRMQTWPNKLNHIFAKNFDEINPSKSIIISDFKEWVSTSIEDLEVILEEDYQAQLLWDQDNSESRVNAPGNLYSDPFTINDSKNMEGILLKHIIPEHSLIDHPLVKEITHESSCLSKFWNRSVQVKASILLPKNYSQGKPYPIRYNIAGYGGRYFRINNLVNNDQFMKWWESEESPEIINVFLDGEGPYGDSYQMDSENSGPYGKNLVEELIPFIEKTYRGTSSPEGRYVDGCSTGGWVSLGLQLYYPDFFDGTFSFSPDAVEFENYQLINIYEDKNAFVNEHGYARPVWRDKDGEPRMTLQEFIRYENVQGSSNTYVNSGGQFSAHNALYSPKGENGLPSLVFDPETGKIDHSITSHWEKYDFKKYLEKNWSTVGPKVAGKIYVWMGDMDHFYLNNATRSLDQFMQTLSEPKSDAIFSYTPGAGHCEAFSHRDILEKIAAKKRI